MSVADTETAIEFVKSIRRLLLAGGFRLHKSLFTSRDILKTIPESERAGSTKEISADKEFPCDRALGINLNVEDDAFVFDIDLKS